MGLIESKDKTTHIDKNCLDIIQGFEEDDISDTGLSDTDTLTDADNIRPSSRYGGSPTNTATKPVNFSELKLTTEQSKEIIDKIKKSKNQDIDNERVDGLFRIIFGVNDNTSGIDEIIKQDIRDIAHMSFIKSNKTEIVLDKLIELTSKKNNVIQIEHLQSILMECNKLIGEKYRPVYKFNELIEAINKALQRIFSVQMGRGYSETSGLSGGFVTDALQFKGGAFDERDDNSPVKEYQSSDEKVFIAGGLTSDSEDKDNGDDEDEKVFIAGGLSEAVSSQSSRCVDLSNKQVADGLDLVSQSGKSGGCTPGIIATEVAEISLVSDDI